MTPDIVIQACREKLAKIEKELSTLNKKVYGRPWKELLELRRQGAQRIQEKGHETKETLAFLKEATKKEKKLLAAMDWQKKNTLKGLDRIVGLQLDADRLKSEIAFAEWQRKQIEDKTKAHALFVDSMAIQEREAK